LNVPVIALSQLSRAVETRGSSKDLYYLIYVNLGDWARCRYCFVLPSEYYKIDGWWWSFTPTADKPKSWLQNTVMVV
jgi:replicative DNA helicase